MGSPPITRLTSPSSPRTQTVDLSSPTFSVLFGIGKCGIALHDMRLFQWLDASGDQAGAFDLLY